MDKWNYKKVIIFTAVLLVVVTVFSVSFAYFTVEVREGPLFTTEGGVAPGTLPDISYTENVAGISLSKTYPMPDENGKKLKDTYTYTITNNDTEKAVDIIVAFEVLNNSTLEDNLVNYLLNDTVHTLGGTNTATVTSSVYKTSYIIETFRLSVGNSKTTSMKFWINENGTLENAQNKNWGGRVVVTAVYAVPSAGENLISKANDISVTDYGSGNMGEMYTFDHDTSSTDKNGNTYVASQIATWSNKERRDYRYIGANPNNWIKFNGEDWRIIGVFTVETASGNKEQLIKIIRNESLTNRTWDSENKNDWPSSSLKILLNSAYYTGSFSFYDDLSEISRKQIEEIKWYLGGVSVYKDLKGTDFYSIERGEITCVNAGNCSGETRSINTIAKVGIMYPSDYIYTYANGVDDTCFSSGYDCDTGQKTNGWIYNGDYQWTIVPFAGHSSSAFYIHSTGYVNRTSGDFLGNVRYSVRPVVYLKSNVKIISGDGSNSENAYQLG